MNVTIALAWIPGLQEIPVNDTADSLAKHTSLEIYKGHLSATCFVTYNDAVRIAADIAKKIMAGEVGSRCFWILYQTVNFRG